MTISIPGSITGTAQTGLTSPTYTTTVDTPPDVNAKQSAITALGGTQTGVRAHAVSDPFTVSAFRPKTSAVLGKPSPTTGLIVNIGVNVYKVITRKGVIPAQDQPSQVCLIRTEIHVPAGSDTFDAPNIRAALSAHIGLLSTASAGIGDTTVNGIL